MQFGVVADNWKLSEQTHKSDRQSQSVRRSVTTHGYAQHSRILSVITENSQMNTLHPNSCRYEKHNKIEFLNILGRYVNYIETIRVGPYLILFTMTLLYRLIVCSSRN